MNRMTDLTKAPDQRGLTENELRKRLGTYVAPHNKSTPDKKFENNWTTKGNDNPTTGASGTRTTEPKK